ncbi:nucleotide-diphospho-sugar transferases superfamily protein [Tasmannia lanceolata]|uniref:nucleotide-diphospho-sugar transferases superfamily protein n=1 Tax=Tasmannia lanceolata TaxID=3420 RepID=UPI004063E09F
MGSFDRSKKKIQVWKKALFHFSLCFVMGLFTGFAPANTASIFSGRIVSNQSLEVQELSPQQPIQALENSDSVRNLNRSLMVETPVESPISSSNLDPPLDEDDGLELINRRLLIIITTTTSSSNRFQGGFLRKLANTLKLIPQPLLWIVVQSHSDSSEIMDILRKTGIMYRHLVYKENFTYPEAETDHQRNMALNHIEHHRLDGIVHFADVSNVYDLQLFEDIREIEVFGTWPVALLSANRKRVVIEGPICSSSQFLGWHLRNKINHTDTIFPIHTSSFAFSSSVLWDPERWGRASSIQDTSQDSMKFVQQVVFEDESKLKVFPRDCSKIMLWHLHIPAQNLSFSIQSNQTSR